MGKGPESKSKLVPLGFALMIAGMALPRALSTMLDGMGPGALREAVYVAMGLLYLGFIVGLAVAIIGMIRNRRLFRG
jgi:hypothetical protein